MQRAEDKTKLQADPRYGGMPTWHSGDWGREMASLRMHGKTQTEEEDRKGVTGMGKGQDGGRRMDVTEA